MSRAGLRAPAFALAATALVAAGIVVAYIALGGGSYKPLHVADPCRPRPLSPAKGTEQISQQILLSALDGAACRLRVTREELALALTTAKSRKEFAREHGITEAGFEDAVRQGLRRAVVDAERAGRLSATQAAILRGAVEALPITQLVSLFRKGRGLADTVTGLLGV